MSLAAIIPGEHHGPLDRAWFRVWSLKDCMSGSRYECECCGRSVQGGCLEQVSAADRVRIEASLAEPEPVERTDWE